MHGKHGLKTKNDISNGVAWYKTNRRLNIKG